MRYRKLHDRIEEAEKNIQKLEARCMLRIGANWWNTVSRHLEVSDQSSFMSLNVLIPVDKDDFKLVGDVIKMAFFKR